MHTLINQLIIYKITILSSFKNILNTTQQDLRCISNINVLSSKDDTKLHLIQAARLPAGNLTVLLSSTVL